MHACTHEDCASVRLCVHVCHFGRPPRCKHACMHICAHVPPYAHGIPYRTHMNPIRALEGEGSVPDKVLKITCRSPTWKVKRCQSKGQRSMPHKDSTRQRRERMGMHLTNTKLAAVHDHKVFQLPFWNIYLQAASKPLAPYSGESCLAMIDGVPIQRCEVDGWSNQGLQRTCAGLYLAQLRGQKETKVC